MRKIRQLQSKHLWMMIICCGILILGFLLISSLGISSPSLETLIFLVCPIGMGTMMFLMTRDKSKIASSDYQTHGEQRKQFINDQSATNSHASIFDNKGRFLSKPGKPFKERKLDRIK